MAMIPMIATAEVASRLESRPAGWTLLDVRDADERSACAIDGSQHIYVGELNERYRDLDPATHYTLMCASGMRATVAAGGVAPPGGGARAVAAGWLASRGFAKLDVYLGSMGAWNAAGPAPA
jgi:hydroxyacylglutathione hydrolase